MSSELAERLAHMDRDALIETLQSLRCSFELDFTQEFLRDASLERLRHIALAAAMRSIRQPKHPPIAD